MLAVRAARAARLPELLRAVLFFVVLLVFVDFFVWLALLGLLRLDFFVAPAFSDFFVWLVDAEPDR